MGKSNNFLHKKTVHKLSIFSPKRPKIDYIIRVNKLQPFMKTMTRDFSSEQLETIKSFFTDSEWDAIDSALSDYQDYGEIESELTSSIHTKLYELFKN